MVWSSNRDHMVQENATLILTSTKELLLMDTDGSLVWSTNTSTQDFEGIVIKESGNLVLLNTFNGTARSVIDYVTIFTDELTLCKYPTPCGSYGVCTGAQCSCPKEGNVFYQVDATKPNLGCLTHRPVVCSDTSINNNSASGGHLLELEHYGANFSRDLFYLESNGFSLQMNNQSDEFYNSTAYIKVHLMPEKNKHLVLVTTLSAIGGVLLLFLLLCSCIRKYLKVKQEKEKHEDDRIDLPARLPLHYSFQELQIATNNFSVKLGRGGFGSVYEEKTHRMLVYEHLPNGSLDIWIFPNKMHHYIARGLAYLHEDCREKIIYFDNKPQNILLDQNFNAKVSDFGLAKLVKREESEVITLLRGTPGYTFHEEGGCI
ncbi:G-type lectin S-receptor-like serine/threonine-protein kinase SD2-5 [Cryptomeria japonica]|uniref:G-type lectin S-receptor-like serine/threonine-protein kinase SD2-5 n=1 Tax=Cryptomeria japonica TaxID=3369 RepID=UPI0025ABA422|nr:G-type lectin S-receptor-like serine/threonine-protein kinase SD2-5 [Cryptomeria japonica]